METMYAKQERMGKMHKLERLALIRQRHRKLVQETGHQQPVEAETTTEIETDIDFDLEFDLN